MNINPKTEKYIHLISDILISVMLVVSGVLFAISCYSVYTSAESQMFTYESIGAAFNKISVFVYITLALVFVGVVIKILLPKGAAKLRSPKRIKVIVSSLAKRVDLSAAEDSTREKISRERKLRKVLFYVNIAFVALSFLLPLLYLLNPANFPANAGQYNSEVLSGILWYSAMLMPLLGYEIAYVILNEYSYSREAEVLRSALKTQHGSPEPENSAEEECRVSAFYSKNEKQITLGVRIAVIVCSVVFIVLGIFNGGVGDVLVKAINICAECIGLG